MPSGFGSVGRKLKSLFGRRPNERPAQSGYGAGGAAEEDAETVAVSLRHVPSAGQLCTGERGQDASLKVSPSVLEHSSAALALQSPWASSNGRARPFDQHISAHDQTANRSLQPSVAPSTSSAFSPFDQGHEPPSFHTTSITTNGSSYFAGAYGFNIQNQQIHNTNLTPSKALFEHLDPHIAHGAAHDSSERCNAPACHEETRVAVRQNIMSWINHGDEDEEPKKIMWLSGPAGGGKTAIAGSVAQQCKDDGSLAATFMFSSFSGSTDRMSKRCLVATLAYHISQHDSLQLFETHLLEALERRRDIFHKSLKDQAQHLILRPLRLIHERDRVGWPKAIIIDGLDEVVASPSHDPTGRQPARTSEDDQVEILDVLATLSQSPSFPFRIFVSSRPESNIAEFFAAQSSVVKLFLDSTYNPDADIKLFLESKFAEIRRRSGIPDAWPGEDALGRLVEMSSGQFIVPTTIVRWVAAGVPQEQMEQVLQLQQEVVASRNPFATLDVLYCHILQRARNPDHDARLVAKWLLAIISTDRFFIYPDAPAASWRQVLEDRDGEFNYRMAPIASLIAIPAPNDATSPVSVYHRSLADFLSTKARCGEGLYIEEEEFWPFIARRILRALQKKRPDAPSSLTVANSQSLLTILVNANNLLSGYERRKGVMKGLLLYQVEYPDPRAALASCDFLWWVGQLLASVLGGRERIVGGVYCTIHKAMKCNENILPSAQGGATQKEQESHCHATCVKWRVGILAKAKELGYCVHELEEKDVAELEKMGWDLIEGSFRQRGCSVCQPGREQS